VFSVGNDEDVCGGSSYPRVIAYCFHSVSGYSKMGKYEGNGLADGAFIHLGFQAKYIMIKNTSVSGDNWYITDDTRDGSNPQTEILLANSSNPEYTTGSNKIDILSNGFKCLDASSGDTNRHPNTYIYMAFAEYPFKYGNAR
jgi:hypothetical protein